MSKVKKNKEMVQETKELLVEDAVLSVKGVNIVPAIFVEVEETKEERPEPSPKMSFEQAWRIYKSKTDKAKGWTDLAVFVFAKKRLGVSSPEHKNSTKEEWFRIFDSY